MKKIFALVMLSLLVTSTTCAAGTQSATAASGDISLHTESYPRPESASATYFFYERGGKVICTEMEVCTAFGQCDHTYSKGNVKAAEDAQKSPASKTPVMVIPKFKLGKHVCLTKYKLL